ncbi:YhfC family intramembrane metalloprotease [Clostridium brassicae]|uniref:YhfC family glutamic-type intramembrane protease n=1 Tax=Clostridium brassicae TaxID=2999072 RepID=A0ABT4DDF8_9CLOT|nr:YhfC family glutamic-type intramembrane protease [Clostridium brassicae]MCY6959176.1 YhfC family glutamic-type intramembrane protease [Clostridium brassicae]
MISNSKLIFMIISTIICFGLPIGLTVYFYKKEKISLFAVFCGALMFIVSQVCLRIPMLQYLNKQPWFINFIKSNTVIYMVLIALSAGIFEEVARFIGIKYILKNRLSWKNGIAFGIGHGGVEAILIVGFTYISNIIYSFFINSGNEIPYADVLINTPSYMFLLGGLERIFAIALHMALTMVVLEGVIKKQGKYILYAISIHALVDFVAVYNKNIFLIEGFMCLVALISLRFLIRSKSKIKSLSF